MQSPHNSCEIQRMTQAAVVMAIQNLTPTIKHVNHASDRKSKVNNLMVAQTVVHTALTNNTQYPPPDLVRIAKSSKIRFSLNQVQRFCTLPEPGTELVVWFCATTKPWTELWSSSEKFRFELWFRTELWHPYSGQTLVLGMIGKHILCIFPM